MDGRRFRWCLYGGLLVSAVGCHRTNYTDGFGLSKGGQPCMLGIARMHAQLGDRDRAAEAYKKYLEVYPKDAAAHHEIALRQAQWKEWSAAVGWCEVALRLDPENRSYRKTLGFCQARAGKWDE